MVLAFATSPMPMEDFHLYNELMPFSALAVWIFSNAPGSNNCGNCPPIPNQKPPTNNCIPTFTWAIPCLQKPPPPSPYEHGSRTTKKMIMNFNQAKLNLEGSHWLHSMPRGLARKRLINPAWHPAVAPPSAAGLPSARAGAFGGRWSTGGGGYFLYKPGVPKTAYKWGLLP